LQEELRQIARRVNWFEPPEELIANTNRFLVYFMQYCLDSDMGTMRKYFSHEQFRHAFLTKPPGIMDEKSTAYWQLILDSKLAMQA